MSPPRRTRDVAVVFASLALALALLVAGALCHRLPAGVNLGWVIYTAGPTAAGGGPGATWGRVAAIVIITVATGKMTSDELR